MRILIPDLAIRAMYNEFRTLVPRNATGNIDGIFLGSGAYSSPSVPSSLNLPSTIGMRNNMLIFSHVYTSLQTGDTPTVRALTRIG